MGGRAGWYVAAKRAHSVSIRAELAGNFAPRARTRGGDLAHDTCITENTESILLDMPLDTTIKVERALRERLSTAARGKSMTVNELLGWLLDDHDRRERITRSVEQMQAAAPDVWDAYEKEFAIWDTAAMDGLEEL